MAIKHDSLTELCALAARQVEDLYPGLRLMFIPHESGQFHQVIETSEHQVLKHPAGKIAKTILDKNYNRDHSSFLGMAIHHQVKWLGLASSEHILALFNLNTGEFSEIKDARRELYNLIWHAIDLMDVRQRPEYSGKFRNGPMIPKRSPMNMAHLNLQADIFSGVMCAFSGDEDALHDLAARRAQDSLSRTPARRAEDYPYLIALESAIYAYEQVRAQNPARGKAMLYARHLALEISRAYDDDSIREWWGFSEPAQDMAWRDFSPEHILSCAIYTCKDPMVQATAHLVAEKSGIEPTPASELGKAYNAFLSEEQNQILHREMIEKTFQEAVAQGVREESGQPLLVAANEQNENLAEGKILGWCAGALQAAARAFERALVSGASPVQAAKMEFEGNKDQPSWNELRQIGTKILDQKRKGFAITLGEVADMCGAVPALAPVLGAVKFTLQDPNFVKKLQVANDLTARPAAPGPAPAAPAFKAQPATPGYAAPAPAGPSLGGSTSNVIARQRAMLDKIRKDQATEEKSS